MELTEFVKDCLGDDRNLLQSRRNINDDFIVWRHQPNAVNIRRIVLDSCLVWSYIYQCFANYEKIYVAAGA